jgi:hypothetical protein
MSSAAAGSKNTTLSLDSVPATVVLAVNRTNTQLA